MANNWKSSSVNSCKNKQGKSGGFDSCDRPYLKLEPNRRFFCPCNLEIWWMTSKNNRAPLLYCVVALCIISKPSVTSNLSFSPETLNSGQNKRFLSPCDLAIWHMTLKNNRAPLLCYFKLCASLHKHWWIQTGITVRKHPIWVKMDDFLAVWLCNLKNDIDKQ